MLNLALFLLRMHILIGAIAVGYQRVTNIARKNSLLKTILHTSQYSMSKSLLKMNSVAGEDEPTTSESAERVWNLKGLRDETNRLYDRTFKKIVRTNERLRQREETLPSEETKGTDLDEELSNLQLKLQRLDTLKLQLQAIRSIPNPEFDLILPDILSLNLTDSKPEKEPTAPKKAKGPKPSPRKPYNVYRSIDDIEIRVGREAEDNDQLSTDPSLRDNNDWWLHVSGLAGSHVVIRYTEDDLVTRHRGTVLDAAMLAIQNSKAKSSGGRVPVSLTRCRNVSKPSGAKPGLVYLQGDVRTINVDVKSERGRLERLKKE